MGESLYYHGCYRYLILDYVPLWYNESFQCGGKDAENGKLIKWMFLQVWNENSSFVTPFEKDAEGHFNYDKDHYYGKIVWWMIPMSN